MRLYISNVTNGVRCPTYDFAKPIEAAMFWNTREWVTRVCDAISSDGITINPPFANSAPCTDFRIEPRPQGGFVISCEYPVTSN